MFVSGYGPSHIPYARFEAALRAGDLGFIRRHAAELTLSPADEVEVRRLISEQEPGEPAEVSVDR